MSLMSLSETIYSPLKENEELTGWSKETINYTYNNKSKVCSQIRGIGKSHNKILKRYEIEDIYQNLLIYLFTYEDYNISKACDRIEEGVVLSLEQYVHTCIKFCVLRYITEQYKYEKPLVREYSKTNETDDQELSIFDTIADKKASKYEEIEYDLDTICKMYESHRYEYGIDIFQVWFVRLETIAHNKKDKYSEIIKQLGISANDVANLEKKSDTSGAMLSIAKAVSIIGVEQAIEVLKKYTYASDIISKVITIIE
jgi:hypothetical protein